MESNFNNDLQNNIIFTKDVVNEIDAYFTGNADTTEILNSDFALQSLKNFHKVLYTYAYAKEKLSKIDREIGIDENYKPETRLEWYAYVYNKASEYLNSNLIEDSILIKNVPRQREMQNVSLLDDSFGPDSRVPRLARRAKYLQSIYSKKILNTLNYLFRNEEYEEMKYCMSLARDTHFIDIEFESMENNLRDVSRISDFLELGVSEVAKTLNKYSDMVDRKKDFDEEFMYATGNIFEMIFGTTDCNNLGKVSSRYLDLYKIYRYIKSVVPKEFTKTSQFKDFESDLRDLQTFTEQFMIYKIIIQSPYKITPEQIYDLIFGNNIFGSEFSGDKIVPLNIFYDDNFNENIKLLRDIINMHID